MNQAWRINSQFFVKAPFPVVCSWLPSRLVSLSRRDDGRYCTESGLLDGAVLHRTRTGGRGVLVGGRNNNMFISISILHSLCRIFSNSLHWGSTSFFHFLLRTQAFLPHSIRSCIHKPFVDLSHPQLAPFSSLHHERPSPHFLCPVREARSI